ncbi:MAG TPA: GIDE domain-containing protein [Terriglobales bacterium]|nr:GIDE domain-containing protein [Terriglobales bacterium]
MSGSRVISLPAFFLHSRGDGVAIAIVGACAGVYWFYRGFRLLQRKRLILNTPASKIHSAAMGLVEINGLAVGPFTMLAPITGVACYYFHTTAWERQQRGRNTEWVKIADESLHVPFFLDDETGRILVDPQGAEMDIHCDFKDEFSTHLFSSGIEIPANVSSFLARNNVFTDKTIKVEEHCIKPKNSLFILGTLAQNPGLSVSPTPIRSFSTGQRTVTVSMPGAFASIGVNAATTGAGNMPFPAFKDEIRQSTPMPSLVMHNAQGTAVPDQQKIATAMMKAGITNPAAWAAAGIDPSAATTAAGGSAIALAPDQFDLHPSTVIRKGAHDPAFFISWRSQRDVVSSLNWQSTLMIWGGPALTMLCVYFLGVYFGWL